ncbi:MAG: signal recognition particle-docking protein FtsY [Chloroflexi bacterium]|nr:MAG: signal recognition particle-docking protein FtsY [Chloroflexota bacterium]TMF21806.1 MAG: signal recognition particle-docking protein FtsY [Chloroflexota bacterium]TMF96800.1 MAG: signal recognition particle-docking protein FtsY [Chloroflexota bacterium]
MKERSFWSRVGERTRGALRALSPPLADGFYHELEEVLIAADLGPEMASRLAAGVRSSEPRTREEAAEALAAAATSVMSRKPRELNLTGDPACILLYGVNGAGKTTTAGKLAHRLQKEGHTPLVVAADTYRAAGIEQMVVWAERAGVAHFEGSAGADPASVVFEAVQLARRRGQDVVIADTAGRLQTQRNLLEELAKVGRVTAKALDDAAYESLLVLDAVLGLTNLVQAREFNKAIPVTGLVLAKLDSSAKGGSIVPIESELDVPAKLAGVGEGIDDLAPFDARAFVRAIFEG